MDDNFASIVTAIEQGRTIFENLKKTIAYTLTHLWPEVVPVLCWLTLDLPLGLTSALILSIDCGTELGPAIYLAYEKQEEDIMKHPPKDSKKERLVSFRVLCYSYLIMGNFQAIVCMLNYFRVFYYKYQITPLMLYGTAVNYFQYGAPDFVVNENVRYKDFEQVNILDDVVSSYYVCLVFCQFFHIWMCKTRRISIFTHGITRNVVMIYGSLIQLAIMGLIVYVPYVQGAFSSSSVDAMYWTTTLIFAAFCWIYNEGRKWFIRHYPNGFAAKYLLW